MTDLTRTAKLLHGVSQKSKDAESELVEQFDAPLRKFLAGRIPPGERGRVDTQDIVQEVWIKVFGGLDRFEYRGVGSFWGYLRRVAINKVRDLSRRKSNQQKVALDGQSLVLPSPQTGVVSGLVRVEDMQLFEQALTKLGEKPRDALLLRMELNLGYRQVAEECGYPSAPAARMAVRRGLRTVFEEMRRAKGR